MTAHDRFEEVVGEIGRDRREYLYEMSYCEVLLIQRGYRRRHVLQYQLQRLQAYGAFHCMSGAKQGPDKWLPMYFDRYIDRTVKLPDKTEIEDMLAEMKAWNEAIRDGGWDSGETAGSTDGGEFPVGEPTGTGAGN